MFYCEFTVAGFAIDTEKQIKKWSRAKKEALINDEFEKLPNLAKKKFKYVLQVFGKASRYKISEKESSLEVTVCLSVFKIHNVSSSDFAFFRQNCIENIFKF